VDGNYNLIKENTMSIYASTANGAVALKSTGDSLTNLFFNIGAARRNPEGIVKTWEDAYLADSKTATAILLWARDIRHGGAGERNVFRTIVKHLAEVDEALANRVVSLIPKIGRFDDLRVFYGTDLEKAACQIWSKALTEGDAIAFKWADRGDKVLRNYMGFKNEGEFRKFISKGRKGTIVETKMCNKDWNSIEYGKLPSVAGARYAKAFKKNDEARYSAFIGNKDTTVNTKALFPHDVYRAHKYGGQSEAASKYWENLPKMDVKGNILVIPDVSGSMCCAASGKIMCIDIAVSLAAYLAQQIEGPFHNKVVAFSSDCSLIKLPNSKDIRQVFGAIEGMPWYGGSTNFQAVFESILADAKKNKATPSQMPTHLLVLSDMQWNPHSGQYDYGRKPVTMHKSMEAAFKEAGYKLPRVVYWNLNAQYGNVPTVSTEKDVALVSGFSPSVLKAVLASKEFTPKDVMYEAIAPFMEMLG
jgi:hypothetical protein